MTAERPHLRLIHGLLFVLMTVAPVAANEIDDFIKTFDSESENGLWPGVNLPLDTSIEKVIDVFAKSQKKTTDADQYEGCKISEIRKIPSNFPSFQHQDGYIVLITSARGSKTILLVRKSIAGTGWRFRPYYITTVP